MFARVARGEIKTGHVDDFVRGWEERVVPIAKQQPGFRRSVGLYDPDTREALSIMFFDTRSHLDSAMPAIQQSTQALGDHLAGPPSVRGYDVRVDIGDTSGQP